MTTEICKKPKGKVIEEISGYTLTRFKRSHLIIGFGSGAEITICKHRLLQQGAPFYSVCSGPLTVDCSEFEIRNTSRLEIACIHNGDGGVNANFPIFCQEAANRIIELIDDLKGA